MARRTLKAVRTDGAPIDEELVAVPKRLPKSTWRCLVTSDGSGRLSSGVGVGSFAAV